MVHQGKGVGWHLRICFLQGDETQKDHLLIVVYTSCECIFDCVNFSAQLGSLLAILSFVCFEEPYRWRITVDAKDVGYSVIPNLECFFFRAPNRSVFGLLIIRWTKLSQTIDICANSFDLFMHQ